MFIDFLKSSGPALLEASVEQVAASLAATAEWSTPLADAVDYLFRHQIVRLLQRRAGRDELGPWLDVMRRTSGRARSVLADTQWAGRWRAFAAVLESRLANLDAQDPESVLTRAHVADVIALVQSQPGIAQRDLGEALGLQKANLSRILSLAEANDLVERRTYGRDNHLYLGSNAPPGAVVLAPPTRRAETNRFASVWGGNLQAGTS